jgi:Spy/CpxP family protein refolding chaperone
MRRGYLFLILAVMAGAVAFCVTRTRVMTENRGLLMGPMSELAWVRNDLELTDAQFAKVQALHSAYRPKCEEMCHRISKAREKVEALANESPVMTPDLEAAIRAHAETRAECEQAMVRHICETAAVMEKPQAERYMEKMLPFALDSSPGREDRSKPR